MTTIKNDFTLLQQAHDFIAQRLTDFFDSEEFTESRFVVNEFDLFTLFITSAAWLRTSQEDQQRQDILIQFHKSLLVAMADRIIENQVEEVDDEKAVALMTMVQNISESRLRDYFTLMKQAAGQESHLFFTSIADAFLEKFISYDNPQLLSMFVVLINEIFQDTLELIRAHSSIEE